MIKRWKWTAGVMLFMIVIAVVISGLVWQPWLPKANALSNEAAQAAVLKLYPGEITATTLSDGVYVMQLRTSHGLYALKVDAGNGQILSLARLKDEFATPAVPADATATATASASSLAESPSESPSASASYLNADEAAQAAADHVAGTIKHTEFKESSKGSYYLVELRLKDGREAFVQVNAISGAVMSVTWDDHGGRGKDDSRKGQDDH